METFRHNLGDWSIADMAALFSALAAIFALIFSIKVQHRSLVAKNTIDALQLIRTDDNYLRNAGLVVPLLRGGRPIDADMVASIRRMQGLPYTVEAPNIGQAVYFILNHHEFLAAAARAGALDTNLLRQTIRGVVVGLVRILGTGIRRFFDRRFVPDGLDDKSDCNSW